MTKTLLILTCSLVNTAAAATITLSPGSPYDVVVQAANVFAGRAPGDLVEGFGFNVTIANPSLFKYTGETAGALFTDLSGVFAGNPMVAGVATNPVGIGPADFTGPLTLATLHFSALQAGTTMIGITSNSSDPNQGLVFANLPYGVLSASTSLSATAAIPEPSSLGLCGLAFAAVFLAAARLRD